MACCKHPEQLPDCLSNQRSRKQIRSVSQTDFGTIPGPLAEIVPEQATPECHATKELASLCMIDMHGYDGFPAEYMLMASQKSRIAVITTRVSNKNVLCVERAKTNKTSYDGAAL
jgi:hypothetical protein